MSSLSQVRLLSEELDELRPLKQDDELRVLQKFRLDWNYHSNHLEGNTLTYGETKALILFGITAQGKPLKDHFEVTGHDEAIQEVMNVVKRGTLLTESFIRELHKLILKAPYEVDAITPDGQPTKKKIKIGQYKSTPNHVKTKTGEIFRFATPEETPALMHDLIEWYRAQLTDKDVNGILFATQFHYKFIRIHPFDDGNGRIARILMNFILMQFGYPPVVIKTNDKENYYAVLRQADAGILEPFVEYITKNLIHSLKIMIAGAKGEDIEDANDIDKEVILLQQRLKGLSRRIKSKEVIEEIVTLSIQPLLKKFIQKCALFNPMYLKHTCYLQIKQKDKVHKGDKIEGVSSDDFADINLYIRDHSSSTILVYSYNSFNQKGFRESHYSSFISIYYSSNSYSVFDQDKIVSLQKFYGEQLTEEEITQLVKSEIRRHKNQIEYQIEKFKKENLK